MMNLTRGLQSLAKQVNVQTNIEQPNAALTLTRSASLAITTAGTTVIWQTEVRNSGFTWNTTDITMPTAGYYSIQVFLQTSANVTLFTQRVVNGVNIGYFGNSPIAINYHASTMIRYFSTNDILQIRVVPSANTTISVVGENAFGESPLLHIMQLSESV